MGVRKKKKRDGTEYTITCDKCGHVDEYYDMNRWGNSIMGVLQFRGFYLVEKGEKVLCICQECKWGHKRKKTWHKTRMDLEPRRYEIRNGKVWCSIPTRDEFIEEWKKLGCHIVFNRRMNIVNSIDFDDESVDWQTRQEARRACEYMMLLWSSKLQLEYSDGIMAVAESVDRTEDDLNCLYYMNRLHAGLGVETLERDLRRLIGGQYIKIEEIVFSSYPENEDKDNVFDLCHVTINPYIIGKKEIKEWIVKYKKELFDLIMYEIGQNQDFKKYGVPMNVLKIDELLITNDSLVFATMSVKELEGTM